VAAETQNNRIDRKLDEIGKIVSEQSAELRELRQAIAFQARETAQVNELVKDKVDRKAAILALEADMETKIKGAHKATSDVKATLGKIAMALFTAVLSLIVAAVLFVVTK
jgi:septal ring factor EnvC (AmiA/AmiB activator)